MQVEIPSSKAPVDPDYTAYKAQYQRRLKIRDDNIHALKQYAQKEQIVGKRISKVNNIQKFTSKLKSDNRNMEALLVEMQTLNLTKYLEEIASIIVGNITEKEVEWLSQVQHPVIQMASKMTQDYPQFSSLFVKFLKKQIDVVLSSDDPTVRASLKAIVYFYMQLFVCGFPIPKTDIPDLIKKVFLAGVNQKQQLPEQQRKEKAYCFHSDIFALLLSRYGQVLCNKMSSKAKLWQKNQYEIKKFPELLTASSKQSITKFFEKYVKETIVVLKQSLKGIKQMENALTEELKLKGEFNPETEKKYKFICQRFVLTRSRLFQVAEGIDEKVETQALTPQILQPSDITKNILCQADNPDLFDDEIQRQMYSQLLEIKEGEQKNEQDNKTYEQFRVKLDSCNNIESADSLTKQFLKINTRKTRKQLIKDLLEYRKKYQLITPFLCRIAANIHQKWKDIAEHVNEQLFTDYDKLKDLATNDPVYPDKKNRNLKYICQFTKYGIIEVQKTIVCLKDLIEHLNGSNVELLIVSLESVGRYLFINKNSATKFVFLMTQLRNVMKKKSFPLVVESQIEECLSILKPAVKDKPKKVKTQLQIKLKQILSKVDEHNINEISIELRMLIEKEENYQVVLKKILKKIVKFSYTCSYLFVVMVKKMDCKKLEDDIVAQSRQKLFQAIKNELSQESLQWARFQGQLYNYELIHKEDLYDILYEMLRIQDNYITVINSICSVLQVSKRYLEARRTTSINQRLRFFIALKKYINMKKYIPMFTQFQILDILEDMQPEVLKLTNTDIEKFINDMNERQKGRKKEINELEELKDFTQAKKQIETQEKNISCSSEEDEKDARRQESPKRSEKEETDLKKNNDELSFGEELEMRFNTQMQKLEGMIAKPKMMENYVRKKEKKKPIANDQPNGVKTIRILGRQGDKPITREVRLKND